jgi:ATP-dependent DNA helicase DinG
VTLISSRDAFLDKEKVLSILRPGGLLSFAIPNYEARQAQLDMTLDVIDSFNQKKIALIEAGTGTGKSVAYLLPALLFANEHQERTCISTHTINLQEQLLFKDIPFLLKTLGLDLKAVLVKGMNNYLCLKRLQELNEEKNSLNSDELTELALVNTWSEQTDDGSKASLPFIVSNQLWSETNAEVDTCTRNECPHFKECFFFKARKNAEDANLLIVNHHLLAADLISKQENPSGGILPSYKRVVVDEAHHLEDVALEHFANKISRWDLQRNLSRLISEKKGQGRIGKLNFLQKKIDEHFGVKDQVISNLVNKIEIDVGGLKQQVTHLSQEAFQSLIFFFRHISKQNEMEEGERKWRLKKEHLQEPLFYHEVIPAFSRLIEGIKSFIASIEGVEEEVGLLDNEKLNEKTKSLRQDISNFTARLKSTLEVLHNFTQKEFSIDQVRWMELRPLKGFLNAYLIHANLSVASYLQNYLFNTMDSIILASATLTTRKTFDFQKKRLGLNLYQNRLIEKIYDSPFNFEKQALLLVPTDMPEPSDESFLNQAIKQVLIAIESSKGGSFVLFTSFSMMKAFQERLERVLIEKKFNLFVQGQDQRKNLLEKFKQAKKGVLFGTDSFWEGVDVVGDALRCVIILKLPFKVPSEPIIEALTEYIEESGGSAFFDYTIPCAIVKFKQGFGRLIRNKNDRGCILCLDRRLLNKGYGKFFLSSLPKCNTLFDTRPVIEKNMNEFYANFNKNKSFK